MQTPPQVVNTATKFALATLSKRRPMLSLNVQILQLETRAAISTTSNWLCWYFKYHLQAVEVCFRVSYSRILCFHLVVRDPIFTGTGVTTVFAPCHKPFLFHIFIYNQLDCRCYYLLEAHHQLHADCSSTQLSCKILLYCPLMKGEPSSMFNPCHRQRTLLKFTKPRLLLCVQAHTCARVWTGLDLIAEK